MIRRFLARWRAERLTAPRALASFLGIAALACSATTRAQVTFAGTQIDVSGTAVSSPSGVALDGKGYVYITDRVNNTLVSVPASTVGFGAPSVILSGLSAPGGVAVDWSGNVFVADTGNNRIVMLPVTSSGYGAQVTLTSSLNSPAGLAVDSSDNIYIADSGNNRIVELPRIGNSYGAPIVVATGFSSPMSVAIDAALTLYVADTGNNRAIKIPISSTGYTTQQVLTKALIAPMGIAVDKSLNVYIADNGNSRIVEDPWNSGAKRYNSPTVVGSDFASPLAVGADWNGNLYVVDGATKQVQEVVTSSIGFMSASLNTAPAIQTYSFRIAAGTAVGNVAIYSQGISGRDFIDAGGSTCTSQTYSVATLCGVQVAFSPQGSGLRTGAVVLYDQQDNILASAYFSGIGLASQAAYLPATASQLGNQLSGPAGVAVDGSGNLFVADTGNDRVIEIPWTGSGYGAQSVLPVTGLSSPMGLSFDGAGNLYIVSNGNDKVIKLPWTGGAFGPQMKVGNGLYGPSGVTVDGVGNLYISDTLDNALDKLPWTGSSYTQAQPLGNYHKFPVGVAVDASGNVYFAMPYQNTLVKIPWTGTQYLTQLTLPLSGVSFPSAIAVDGNSNLYVLDAVSGRLVMLPWTGSAFGGQVTVASGFNTPTGLAIDVQGNLYVADTGNNQIVKLDLSRPGAMTFADTYLGSTSADSAQIALVENIGNQPLSLQAVTYPKNFPEDPGAPSACTSATTILPGSSCQLPIDFIPQIAATGISEEVNVTVTAEEGTGVLSAFPVSGNGMGRQAQSISFPGIADTVYGASPVIPAATSSSGLTVTYQIISGPAILGSAGRTVSITGAGTVTVQATQQGNSTYAPATPIVVSFYVAPAVLTVTPLNVTAVYGSVPQKFSYSITGFVAGQSSGQAVTGQAAVSVSIVGSLGAGTYTIAASQGTLASSNYAFVFSTGTLTVTKAMLQVKAASVTVTYGSAPPKLAWTISGLVDGDTTAIVTGAPSLTSNETATSPIGSYQVTAALGTLAAANYSFSFSPGTISVVPAVLTVIASNQTVTYGAALPVMTYTITGFMQKDTSANAVSGVPAMAAQCASAPKAGIYPIVPSQGSLKSTNYTFLFVQGSLQVVKAALTVRPADATMAYGGNIPALSYSISGFVYNDTRTSAISGSPVLGTTATSLSKPGSYQVTVSTGSLSASNYTFIYQTGTLTISKAQLTVSPVAAAMTYGSTIPAFTAQYSGFVNGDGVDTVHGLPSFTTQATSASPAGKYTVVSASGSLSSDLYTFAYANGSLTVTKALLTLTPTPVSITYGGASPQLTYSISGLLNGDTAAVIKGAPLYTNAVSRITPAGTYSYQMQAGSLNASNYNFAFANGTATVNKAILTVAVHSASMTYGTVVPGFTASISGFVNGDAASVVSGAASIQTTATANSAVGVYAVKGSIGSLSATNYTFNVIDGQLTINPAVLTVTANSQIMTYGGNVPVMTYTISGLVGNDSLQKAITGAAVATTSATAASPAGQYKITIASGSLASANYTFQFVTGTMTVNKAQLKLAANSLSMKAGSAVPELTWTPTGLVNGDTIASALHGAPALTTTAAASSKAGSYPITIAAGTASAVNYSFTYVNGTLTVTQ